MADVEIFNKKLRILHRNRASKNLAAHNFLLQEVADRLGERLAEEITKKFKRILIVGSWKTLPYKRMFQNLKTDYIVYTDISQNMLDNKKISVCMDEEFIPFKDKSFDLVISLLDLHWVNDIPGCLIQLRRVLEEDGLFLGAIFGGDTLKELREALSLAEIDLRGGISPRVSSFTDIKDAGMLLSRAGFKSPVTDSEIITVTHSSILSLMHDLRGMGETNAMLKMSKQPLTKEMLSTITSKMKNHTNPDGQIRSSFEIISMTAWKN